MPYTFADCTLDTQNYVLWRAGTPHRLRPKIFQVLQDVMQHRDRVVAKQELAEQLWPDQYICAVVVENTIMAVRRVVGDSGRGQDIIQTLPGHGYRFIAAVAESGAAPPGAAAPGCRPNASGRAATTAAAQQAAFTSVVTPSTRVPLPMVQGLGASEARNRCAAVRQQSLRPLVGRTEELRLLRHRGEQASSGHGQGVWLCGEGGIGKSRLVEALHEQVRQHGYT
jgi:DNA-binding winged helix-turn-helix (wHTH) protein